MTPTMREDAGEEKKEEYDFSAERLPYTKGRPKPVEVPSSKPGGMTSRVPPSKANPSFWSKAGSLFLSLLSLSAHSILFICFLALAVAYCLQSIHDNYFVPIMERARRTDDDLLHEFTYYQRECSAMDVTASIADAPDLFIRPNSKNYGVDQMMTHGSVLFPDLLSPETVKELRKFVVAKNAIVKGTPSEFPVSQGYRRISYGIEATENPAVVRALKEIHDNVQLQHLLEGLLGKNPALTEITAITASYGCEAQAWHPDVKPDGNGVKFGRTYSHSYSLFMPLQDTTGEMGATDLCPGTHYCAGDYLHELCEAKKIGMHQVSGQGYWPAGSAALLNQQVWHRGSEHADENAEDRVVFIVSFLARPNDTRQLSRGTYFHMKWNMWGHTWADLDDSMRFMSWPWNILTCLHIWRPASNGWGYDLITSAAMRIANNQNGCQPHDLGKFLEVLDRFGFPTWLDGPISFDRPDAWQVYIRETVANIWQFCLNVNIQATWAYFVGVLLLAHIQLLRGRSGLQVLWGSARGVIVTHGIVTAMTFFILTYVRQQPYAKDITEGRMLMRPFAPVNATWLVDPAVPRGPTTFPNRRDVLFGGRMDVKTIGAYNRWLEFHPGNQKFLEGAEAYGGATLYRSYFKDLPPVFARAFVDAVMEPILSSGGRILQQDYRSGVWLYPDEEFRDELVQKALFVGRQGPLYELQKEHQFLLSDARFGYARESSMARASLGFLYSLESKLFGRFVVQNATSFNKPMKSRYHFSNSSFVALPTIKSLGGTIYTPRVWITRSPTRTLEDATYTVGEEVAYFSKDVHSPDASAFFATVADVNLEKKTVDIALYSGEVQALGWVIRTVPWHSVRKMPVLYEGSPVLAEFKQRGKYFPGRAFSIHPSGAADIKYDNGEIKKGVPSDRYNAMLKY